MATYSIHTTELTVIPDDAHLYDERATRISMDDETGGPFVALQQNENSVRIDLDEWPTVRQAVDAMIAYARQVART